MEMKFAEVNGTKPKSLRTWYGGICIKKKPNRGNLFGKRKEYASFQRRFCDRLLPRDQCYHSEDETAHNCKSVAKPIIITERHCFHFVTKDSRPVRLSFAHIEALSLPRFDWLSVDITDVCVSPVNHFLIAQGSTALIIEIFYRYLLFHR
mgnify:CR=1 FL=1